MQLVKPPLDTRRIWLARSVAVLADVLQFALFPFTSEGVFSPVADGLDVIVAVILTLLIGPHIAFIPSFAIKLLPVADLAPTWTIAVWIATRGMKKSADDSELPALEHDGVDAGAKR